MAENHKRHYSLESLLPVTIGIKYGIRVGLSILVTGGCLAQVPAIAGSWTDIETLKTELNKTGTKVVELKCKEKELMSYYEFEEKKTDRIVIYKNNIDIRAPRKIRDSLN